MASSLRDYEDHLREQEEAPRVPGPIRFAVLVFLAVALGLTEHGIRRRFPLPVLPLDWYLLWTISGGWLLVSGWIALGVRRSRRLRAQLLWLLCAVGALGLEYAWAEWDWRPMQRMEGIVHELAFEEADAATMKARAAREAADGRIDARISELRRTAAEATGQSAAALRGWLAWKTLLRTGERKRLGALYDLSDLAVAKMTFEEMKAKRDSIGVAVTRLRAASKQLEDLLREGPGRLQQELVEAGVWEWRADALSQSHGQISSARFWERIYQLEARMTAHYGEFLRSLDQPDAFERRGDAPSTAALWLRRVAEVESEHRQMLRQLEAARAMRVRGQQ